MGETKGKLSKMFLEQVWLFFFFSQNAKLGFAVKNSLLKKRIDFEMQNLICFNRSFQSKKNEKTFWAEKALFKKFI